MKTTRTRAFFLALRLALLGIGVLLGLGPVQPATAQQNLVNDSGVINLYDPYCLAGGPDDGCNLESFAVIYDTTTGSSLNVVDQTSVTLDSFDDGYNAFVCGYIYQDGALYASGCVGDNGNGVAAVGGSVAINTTNGPHQYTVHTDSYYDYYVNGGCEGGGSCYFITSTQLAAWIGPPRVTSVSPAYVFVGTSGTITIGGQALVNPFGAGSTTVMAVPAVTGATGLTLSANAFTATRGTANSQATLTATTGPWDIGLGTQLGSTFYSTTTKGLFTVGDPTPSISSVSPNSWTAGQTNIPVTIKGSGFGSNPILVVAGSGVSSSITGHTDNGQPGGAQLTANVTVSACGSGSAAITVTSTGYNGTGFGAAYTGQSPSGTSSATIIPAPAGAPNILFNGANVAGKTTTVVVGQKITLTGQVPTQACMTVASQQWSLPGKHTGETAVGGATAATAGGFTLNAIPSGITSTSYGPFYWVYAGTFPMTYQYTLSNGVHSPVSTATFTVKGLTGTPMSTVNYGKLNDNTLTICNTTTTEKVLVYGSISGTTCPKGTLGTPGELFTASGAPGGGKYSFVQLINSDTSTFTSASGTVTCTHNAGVDNSYPYAAQINTTQANDAPYVVLPTSPYNKITRSFSASMYLIWTSSVTGSITIPAGSIKWQFSGATTLTSGKWGSVTGSGTANAFVAANGTQSDKGYPLWTGPSNQTCN
jgi:hypothetical protein